MTASTAIPAPTLGTASAAGGRVRIGLSGWRYAGWRGAFYPAGLAQRSELAYAARQFDSLEINGSFYGLLHPEDFAQWREQTPSDFVFAIKGSRYITHMLRLRNAELALANFMASGLLGLGPKLGPILWQLPARQTFDLERLDGFLAVLPRSVDEAQRLAALHDERLVGRSWLECDWQGEIRHALEIRHPSFVTPAFVDLLRHHRVALVCADTVDWPLMTDLTTDFVYCRLHGSQELYVSGYEEPALQQWAARIAAWRTGGEQADDGQIAPALPVAPRDVYLYFDNDAKVRAPIDAHRLIQLLAGVGAQLAECPTPN